VGHVVCPNGVLQLSLYGIGDEWSGADDASTLFMSMKLVHAFRRGNFLRENCDDSAGVDGVVISMSSGASIIAAKVVFCILFLIS
jgi:hypothetical protein